MPTHVDRLGEAGQVWRSDLCETDKGDPFANILDVVVNLSVAEQRPLAAIGAAAITVPGPDDPTARMVRRRAWNPHVALEERESIMKKTGRLADGESGQSVNTS